jgi:uncharacterized GH25 family protein
LRRHPVNRWYLAAVVFLAAATAQAHHIWIIPDKPDGPTAKVVFADFLEPDKPDTLAKIGHTKLFVRDAASKESPLGWKKGTWKKGEDTFLLDVPGAGERTVGGECVYGIVTHDHRLRKEVEPYLLVYYPKAVFNLRAESKPWERLPLEIVPAVSADKVRLRVLHRGKPAAGAEMRVHPADGDREDLKTDERGEIKVPFKAAGVYGFQTRHIEAKGGEHDGKKYVEVRHYASLVLVRPKN